MVRTPKLYPASKFPAKPEIPRLIPKPAGCVLTACGSTAVGCAGTVVVLRSGVVVLTRMYGGTRRGTFRRTSRSLPRGSCMRWPSSTRGRCLPERAQRRGGRKEGGGRRWDGEEDGWRRREAGRGRERGKRREEEGGGSRCVKLLERGGRGGREGGGS
eukprot:3190813-Rhodomonas_salina.1